MQSREQPFFVVPKGMKIVARQTEEGTALHLRKQTIFEIQKRPAENRLEEETYTKRSFNENKELSKHSLQQYLYSWYDFYIFITTLKFKNIKSQISLFYRQSFAAEFSIALLLLFSIFYNSQCFILSQRECDGVNQIGQTNEKQRMWIESSLPQEGGAIGFYVCLRLFRDIRINADDQSSRKILIYCFFIVVTIVVVAVLVAYAIPSSVIKVDQKKQLVGSSLQGCNGNLIMFDSSLLCGDDNSRLRVGQYLNNLQRLNQFLAFYLAIDAVDSKLVFKEKIYFRLYSAIRTTTELGKVIINTGNLLNEKQIEINSADYYQSHFYLDFINKISQDDIYWQLQFRIGSSFQLNSNFQLQSYTINPQYSVFCITLRCVFLAIACVTFCCGGLKYYRSYKGRKIIPEQFFIFNLSILTITFNDPFYVITILFPNAFTSILSTLFLWNFVAFLFIIWIFFLQRIQNQQSSFETKLLDKGNIAIGLIFYIITLSYRFGQSIYETYDRPFINPNQNSSTYLLIAFIFSTAVFGLAVMYVLYLYCNICEEWSNYQWRSKAFIYISLFFFSVVVGLFISGSYNIFQYSPMKMMVTVTFTNIYSFYLQYLYSPVQQSLEQGQDLDGKAVTQKQTSHIEFQDGDIQIDLQKDHFQDFISCGENIGQDGELFKPTKSYLGEYLRENGSKIKSEVIVQKSTQ